MMRREKRNPRRSGEQGFLLLVVVGLLAVMLTLVIGFLSFTRNQADAVIHVRDRSDAIDMAHSVMDFTIANMAATVIDPTTKKFDSSKWVSNSNDDTPAGGGNWWYTPYEPNAKSRPDMYQASYVNNNMQQKDAKWRYMPIDFFPDGSLRGRYAVQVVDGNSAIHMNDWLEDCNPTQTQMAHMMQDSSGIHSVFEGFRANIDGVSMNQPGPYRYLQCWNMATRTVRYYHHNWSFTGNYRSVSPNWTVSNTSWFSPYGAEYNCLNSVFFDEMGPSATGAEWSYFYYKTGMTQSVKAGTDPDTGRSPLNVNTCEISGQEIPYSTENHTWSYSLEGVFNVESLARIIKVGKFRFDADGNSATPPVVIDANTDTSTWLNESGVALTAAQIEKAQKLEEALRMKLAFWYQEILVRYFCGAYSPGSYGNAYMWSGNGEDYTPANYSTYFGKYWNNKFVFRWNDSNGYKALRSYYQAFGYVSTQTGKYRGALQPAEVNRVLYAVKPGNTSPTDAYPASAYYKTTRFPVSLDLFRQHVAADLTALTVNNNNWSAGVVCAEWMGAGQHDPNSGNQFLRRYDTAGQTALGIALDGELCVNFDKNNTPEIIPGKMDKRTANAVFDNIIPGKVWKDATGTEHFLLFEGDGRDGVRDPLWELYGQRVGRDENDFCKYNRRNLWVSTAADRYNEKGKDIVAYPTPGSPYETRPKVPWRQLTFGPDSFSTELTTTSNTFWVIVTTQVVDAKSALVNPNNPDVKTSYMQSAIIELTPDIDVNTDPGYDGEQWPNAGAVPGSHLTLAQAKRVALGYYRGGWPRKIKTTKLTDTPSTTVAGNSAPDYFCMDEGMKTAFDLKASPWLPVLPDTASASSPPTSTASSSPTVPPEWIDFRGVTEADRGVFYKEQNPAVASDKGRQTSKRVTIRQLWSTNQGL